MSKLNKCQLFYLEQNADKPAEQLAEDMGVSLSRVTTAMNRLNKDRQALAAVEQKPPEAEPQRPPQGRAVPVVMTQAMSHQYDEAQKSRSKMSPKLAKSVSVVDPNARIY